MKEKLEFLLEPQMFKAWLADHRPNDVVGVGCEPHACPIACYLKDMGAGQQVKVIAEQGEWLALLPDGEAVPLPKWAGRFAYMVDRLRPKEAISAQYALGILREILRGGD